MFHKYPARSLPAMFMTLVFLLGCSTANAASDAELRKLAADIDGLGWTNGPAEVKLTDRADLTLDKSLKFLAPPDSNKFIELNGNPPSEGNYILSKVDYSWFANFTYIDSGYIKDDETIDEDALLKTLKEESVTENEEREKLNLDTMELVGWFVDPHYDAATKRLEWGTKYANKDGTFTINYTIRILARRGYMAATLVSSPDTLANDVVEFKKYLAGFSFSSGENYAEFRQGDKVAAYGLGALIAGGAAAVAVKSGGGFIKAIGLAILAGLAGVFGFVRNLFRRK